jgi:hypothetical protein
MLILGRSGGLKKMRAVHVLGRFVLHDRIFESKSIKCPFCCAGMCFSETIRDKIQLPKKTCFPFSFQIMCWPICTWVGTFFLKDLQVFGSHHFPD